MKNLKCLFSNIYSLFKGIIDTPHQQPGPKSGPEPVVASTETTPAKSEGEVPPQKKGTDLLKGKIDQAEEAQRLQNRREYLKPISNIQHLPYGREFVFWGRKERKEAEKTMTLKDFFNCPYLAIYISENNKGHVDRQNKVCYAEKGNDGQYHFVDGGHERVQIFSHDRVLPSEDFTEEDERGYAAAKR